MGWQSSAVASPGLEGTDLPAGVKLPDKKNKTSVVTCCPRRPGCRGYHPPWLEGPLAGWSDNTDHRYCTVNR